MSVNSDSIQTLLRQRRELRDCLSELREEISALNKSADQMMEKTALPLADQKETTQSQTVSFENEEPVAEAHEQDAMVKSQEPPAQKAPAPPKLTILHQPTDSPSEPKAEDVLSSNKPVEMETLLQQAVLLAGFFLHHPSSAGNETLNHLDTIIRKVQSLPKTARTEETEIALKNAYRNVLKATYSKNNVNGQSLVQSLSSIPLLWMLPMAISGLVLVFYPLLLLLKSNLDVFVDGEIAQQAILVAGISLAFLWGATGSMSFSTLKIARSAQQMMYEEIPNKALMLNSCCSGVLAIAGYFAISASEQLSGVLEDILVGSLSFCIGFSSSIFIHMFLKRNLLTS